jgi:hypothetical protein
MASGTRASLHDQLKLSGIALELHERGIHAV